MPCFYSGGGSLGAALGSSEDRNEELRHELDRATRLLCEILTAHPKLARETAERAAWWKEHQEQDRKRHTAPDHSGK